MAESIFGQNLSETARDKPVVIMEDYSHTRSIRVSSGGLEWL